VRENGPVLTAFELGGIAIERITALGEIPAFLFGTEDSFFLYPTVVLVETSGLRGGVGRKD